MIDCKLPPNPNPTPNLTPNLTANLTTNLIANLTAANERHDHIPATCHPTLF
jgi:hypothetical protein